jgi:hypothetical protein
MMGWPRVALHGHSATRLDWHRDPSPHVGVVPVLRWKVLHFTSKGATRNWHITTYNIVAIGLYIFIVIPFNSHKVTFVSGCCNMCRANRFRRQMFCLVAIHMVNCNAIKCYDL